MSEGCNPLDELCPDGRWWALALLLFAMMPTDENGRSFTELQRELDSFPKTEGPTWLDLEVERHMNDISDECNLSGIHFDE